MTAAPPRPPEANIGTIGHVDHGKTTLVESLTGVWASRHSEELRRGITIKLGYADAAFYRCPVCPPPRCYSAKPTCSGCGGPAEFLRTVSFVDAPGHEILMATMLCGAAVMDGAILVIAADEPCPQPQTREHLAAVEIMGMERLVIVQNKIDIVDRKTAERNYQQIVDFTRGSIAADAPIIPVSAQHGANIDYLIEALEKEIPTPQRDPSKPGRMLVVRSFDVNKPGTRPANLVGGVIGGSMVEGVLSVGDEVEIRPGMRVEKKGAYEPLFSTVVSLHYGTRRVEKAAPGGLVGVGTKLDPSLTKADKLVGNLLGKPGSLPEVWSELTLDVTLFERAVGTAELVKVSQIKVGEALLLNVATAVTSGIVSDVKKDRVEIPLRRPVCATEGQRVAISRRIGDRWRLIGYGVLR
ncbi:MAG: translation initiation factor IF-2 subunit gamma [Candidatus Bathyarchaeia archaeon]